MSREKSKTPLFAGSRLASCLIGRAIIVSRKRSCRNGRPIPANSGLRAP